MRPSLKAVLVGTPIVIATICVLNRILIGPACVKVDCTGIEDDRTASAILEVALFFGVLYVVFLLVPFLVVTAARAIWRRARARGE